MSATQNGTYNSEPCSCGLLRFQHTDAVLCDEEVVSDTQLILARLDSLEAKINYISAFITEVREAIDANPMAKMLLNK